MSKYLALRLEVEKQKSFPGNDALLKFDLCRETYNSKCSYILGTVHAVVCFHHDLLPSWESSV